MLLIVKISCGSFEKALRKRVSVQDKASIGPNGAMTLDHSLVGNFKALMCVQPVNVLCVNAFEPPLLVQMSTKLVRQSGSSVFENGTFARQQLVFPNIGMLIGKGSGK